jgi:hypothetical protein
MSSSMAICGDAQRSGARRIVTRYTRLRLLLQMRRWFRRLMREPDAAAGACGGNQLFLRIGFVLLDISPKFLQPEQHREHALQFSI